MPERPPSDEWVEAANCLATVADTLSSAVHEANNMLQVITGSAEMIQMHGGLPPSVIKRTEIMTCSTPTGNCRRTAPTRLAA